MTNRWGQGPLCRRCEVEEGDEGTGSGAGPGDDGEEAGHLDLITFRVAKEAESEADCVAGEDGKAL